ncbi:acetoin utilization protein AcuC [Poseidonocella pacifica]|uniref:acetoin utilization protein AcuC n=1 Tax=Poseidonocella pacifica TaxID=871651 RepID=UPI001FDF8979|nr:acetoin utilization protein AcuC [Poseidonocella pacifica]
MIPRFVGSEIYRGSSYGPAHPLRVPRVSTVMDLVRAMGWLAPNQYLTSPRAKPEALSVWHDPDYLAALQDAERVQAVSDAVRARHALGTAANPIFPEVFRRPATGVGGVMLAAAGLGAGPGVWHVPGGGTHHGMPDRANGFCYLNDPVIAILSLRAQGLRRIAYVDIDAHHPDGVEYAFANDPDVLLVSIHEENRWPRTGALEDEGAGQVFNLPVPREFHDDEMALVRDRMILPAVAAFRPEALVLQCGADAVTEDPQSRLSLSNNAHWSVVSALRSMSDRIMVLGGGGYNPWSAGRLWAGNWAILNNLEIPERLPAEAETVLRGLEFPGHRLGRAPPAHWFTTLRDAPREGPVRDTVRARVERLEARLIPWV